MADVLAASGDPLRAAFGRHLLLVADAMHAVEWVDSCDWGPGDEVEAIKAALSPLSPGADEAKRLRDLATGLERLAATIDPK